MRILPRFSRNNRLYATPDKRSAFALVVVLAILAMLLVLVLSLSSVLHVETRSSASSKDLTLARQNALLGLEVAVGQLQEYAGKDQAVTFPATTFYPLKNVNDPTTAAPRAGKGPIFDDATFGYRSFAKTANARSYLDKAETYLTPKERAAWDAKLVDYWNAGSASAPRNPHWFGIMDSSLRVDAASNPNAAPTSLAAQSYESGAVTKFGEFKRDQLPVWLVSGNENLRFDPATATSYPAGYYTPDKDIQSQVSSDPNLTIPSGKTVQDYIVTLVGSGSSANASLSSDGLDGTVKVKKQEVKSPATDGSIDVTGHYAYWVGDESTKANFAVRDPFSDATPGSVDYRNRLQSPQRVGWENIAGFVSGNGTRIATFDANDPRLDNISTSREISLMEETNTAEIYDAAKANFHSLTAYSRSLLTDTALGGAKKRSHRLSHLRERVVRFGFHPGRIQVSGLRPALCRLGRDQCRIPEKQHHRGPAHLGTTERLV